MFGNGRFEQAPPRIGGLAARLEESPTRAGTDQVRESPTCGHISRTDKLVRNFSRLDALYGTFDFLKDRRHALSCAYNPFQNEHW